MEVSSMRALRRDFLAGSAAGLVPGSQSSIGRSAANACLSNGTQHQIHGFLPGSRLHRRGQSWFLGNQFTLRRSLSRLLRSPVVTNSHIPKEIERPWSQTDPPADLLAGQEVEEAGASALVDDVAHLRDHIPDLQMYDNPLMFNAVYKGWVERDPNYFIAPYEVVVKEVIVATGKQLQLTAFRRAGPRETIAFAPGEVRAAIVTCGGLCPGLNTVVREIVCGLWAQYGVRDIVGIEGGYKGFYARNTISLDPRTVNNIHKRGGSVLGTSRGGHETAKIVNAMEDRGINQVFIIGGDGTQRGADAICQEVKRRGLKVAVAGIPKTIDNDIPIIDKSFGFDTAVEEAQRAINAAHVEAESVENGIGVVKLMGRYSGYIAMYATLGSRDVDCCLIPEVSFFLEGKGGLFEFTEKRLREDGHMVLVVAEGAGQELMAGQVMPYSNSHMTDQSGNRLLLDVGLWLSEKIRGYFKRKGKQINLKYIDPTYMIRAIPSNASDNVYCTLLAHSAVHGVMAGFTGFTVGPVNGRHAYIPISRVIERTNKVPVNDRMWARLVNSTNQPDFWEAQKELVPSEEQEAMETERLRLELDRDAEDWQNNPHADAIAEFEVSEMVGETAAEEATGNMEEEADGAPSTVA